MNALAKDDLRKKFYTCIIEKEMEQMIRDKNPDGLFVDQPLTTLK